MKCEISRDQDISLFLSQKTAFSNHASHAPLTVAGFCLVLHQHFKFLPIHVGLFIFKRIGISNYIFLKSYVDREGNKEDSIRLIHELLSLLF